MIINKAYLSTKVLTSQFAAEELKHYYKMLTRQELELVDSPEEADLIVVGDLEMIELPDQVKAMASAVFEDGYVSGVFEGKVYLASKCPRGLLYAVYGLLKHEAGVIFAAPGREYVPELKEFRVSKELAVVNPKLKYRGIGFHNGWDAYGTDLVAEIDWMVKMGLNWVQFFPESYEGRREGLADAIAKRDIVLDVGAHSAFFFVSPDKYSDSIPELFSRTAEGEFIGKQLCYGNPATREKLAEACLDYLNERPEVRILGLWPEDGGGDCECNWCHGKDRQKLVGDVVNYVAEKILDKSPDVLINHLAYCQFIKPHKELKFAPNVLVNHCDYWSRAINHPIYDFRYGQSAITPPEARKAIEGRGLYIRDHSDIVQELVDWGKSSEILTAFSYYSDLVMKQSLFTDVSETIEADLNFYTAMGMNGFVDCCCYPEKSLAFAFNWFALASFSWEESGDREKILKQFAMGYFGPDASEGVVQVYDLVKKLMNAPSLLGYNILDLFHRDSSEVAWQCGTIDRLVEPENKRIEQIFNIIDLTLEAPGTEELKIYIDDLRLRYSINFNLYLAWANIYRDDFAKAKVAMDDANKALNKYKLWDTKHKAGYDWYVGCFERFIKKIDNHLSTSNANLSKSWRKV